MARSPPRTRGRAHGMALATRDAQVTWEGTLGSGHGQLAMGSGATQSLPMEWASRSESADGTTSPEELLAAAEAGCYAMALALGLARHGTPAERLHVRCVCQLDKRDGEPEYVISGLRLEVGARVPQLDEETFQHLVERAEANCPISIALAATVPIELSATLEG